uniref:hypothetical protein n=1 Tax=Bacteroides sp. TaxID=29523 RepID=UPI0025BEA519
SEGFKASEALPFVLFNHQEIKFFIYVDPFQTFIHICSGFELIHHRVTQSLTELNQFEIKKIELRDTLCYSVVKTHYGTVLP